MSQRTAAILALVVSGGLLLGMFLFLLLFPAQAVPASNAPVAALTVHLATVVR